MPVLMRANKIGDTMNTVRKAVAAKNPGKCKVKHCACKGYYVDTVTGKSGRLPKKAR